MDKGVCFGGWVRIDDRLIHGQVTVGWRQYLRYHEIWVVDDAVCADPYIGAALRLAAPVGVEVRVMGLEEAAAAMTEGEIPAEVWMDQTKGKSVLVLLRDPEDVLALVEGGVVLDRVNVGNLGSRPGSVRAIKSVSLTQEQIDALDALAGYGIEVFFQPAPEDTRLGWGGVRRRVKR